MYLYIYIYIYIYMVGNNTKEIRESEEKGTDEVLELRTVLKYILINISMVSIYRG